MIRYGNINDLEQVLELIRDVKFDLKMRNLNIWEDDYPNKDFILEDLSNNNSLLNIKDGKLAGYMAILHEPDMFEDVFTNHDNFLYFTRVMVSTRFRRQGIAKELFNFAFNLNYKSYRISVHPSNKNAYNLYKSLGFSYLATKEYPWGPLELYERM